MLSKKRLSLLVGIGGGRINQHEFPQFEVA